MATFENSQPDLTKIGQTQNLERNLRRQAAKHRYYTVAKRYHIAGSGLAIALALASPLVLLYAPKAGPLLGAVSAAWLFTSRLLLEPIKRSYQEKGARAQEMFDCDVLGIAWNDTLAEQLSDEDIRKAGRKTDKAKVAESHRNWYPTETRLSWSRSVVVCQRANTVWAGRQHRSYGILLFTSAGTWGLVGLGLALSQSATLAQYLTTVALPSLPALLDSVDLGKRHRRAADHRHRLEQECDDLYSDPPSSHEPLRELQDQMYTYRRDAPVVAGWYYKMVRSGYEEDMKYAAAQRQEED